MTIARPQQAYYAVLQRALDGDPDAMVKFGKASSQESEKAAFFLAASTKGSREGMKALYNLVASFNTESMRREQFNWLIRSVEVLEKKRGDTLRPEFRTLCIRTADQYFEGKAVARDPQMALYYMQKAIDLGVKPEDGKPYRKKYEEICEAYEKAYKEIAST